MIRNEFLIKNQGVSCTTTNLNKIPKRRLEGKGKALAGQDRGNHPNK